MSEVIELRKRMDQLMRERGVRTLASAKDPDEWATKFPRDLDERPFTAYPEGRLYGWDQYFEAILQIYAGWELTYIQNSLKIVLERVERDGFVPRTFPRVWWGMFHAQPFLAQQALLLLKAGDGLEWLYPEYFYLMKKYLLYWLRDLDVRGQGLSVWDHAGHTGMDNHYERAGTFHDAHCEGVDLNCYLIRECEAFAILSERGAELKLTPLEAGQWRERAERMREAVNRWCWNEEEGIYYDYHAREGHQIPVKYVGAFATLWAKVADRRQAERLVREHLLNPAEFWRPNPLPALAATEPGYVEGHLDDEHLPCCSWRAHTWMPTNYYTFQGIRQYGFDKEARELAARSRELFCREPFREYYATETGKGWGRDPFTGWSSLALFMEEELEKGLDPTAVDAERNWSEASPQTDEVGRTPQTLVQRS